jgi:CDP-diacylglycerol--glycerol-3-phosphate 3-phosphatidyltransferase
MSTNPTPARPQLDSQALFNIPNQLTSLRLILSIVLFVTIPLGYYVASTILFCIAAGTDWLDGYYARKYGQVTTLGRILDPFVDKIIICGTFIMLCAVPNQVGMAGLPGSGIESWMAVVVMGRELLVTTLRSFLEGEGRDFSAKWSGKIKMGFQCMAVIWSLVALQFQPSELPEWIARGLPIAAWLAVIFTVYSGVIYVFAAIKILSEKK